jgi:hypothetical protein
MSLTYSLKIPPTYTFFLHTTYPKVVDQNFANKRTKSSAIRSHQGPGTEQKQS